MKLLHEVLSKSTTNSGKSYTMYLTAQQPALIVIALATKKV